MSAAYRYLPHYTAEDYRRWDGDWELWQGIPISMSPSPFGTHQRIAKNLVFELEWQVRDACPDANVLYEIDWVIADDTIVRPDVIVVSGPPPHRHVETVPSLVAEVTSESTAIRDREAKRDLYDDQGVGTYLLIDPQQRTLEIFRRIADGCWSQKPISDQVTVSLCDDCDLVLRTNALFR